MIKVIILDSGPLGLLVQRKGVIPADQCRDWFKNHLARGLRFVIPEIADYEVRRELIRISKFAAISDLDSLEVVPGAYAPLTTIAIRLAANLWAQARTGGFPTADPRELDADVLIAAQALSLGIVPADLVVATSNPSHISRFAPADLWQNI